MQVPIPLVLLDRPSDADRRARFVEVADPTSLARGSQH